MAVLFRTLEGSSTERRSLILGFTRGVYHLRPHPSIECELDDFDNEEEGNGVDDCDDVAAEFRLHRDYYLFGYSAGWFTKAMLIIYGYAEVFPSV
ncbi:hypothetical protein OB919_18780 [Halobacteria archaeon AArc-curdl1]|uniref:Uncharacterized protein n=1 Tax=Natronosalvus hydrolyticus TaxID=2979988 RepID=A0AAP2ZBS2_9EURY|nr:hypothetical protein [Halobacteria archaeon AArc-curdl1]